MGGQISYLPIWPPIIWPSTYSLAHGLGAGRAPAPSLGMGAAPAGPGRPGAGTRSRGERSFEIPGLTCDHVKAFWFAYQDLERHEYCVHRDERDWCENHCDNSSQF